MVRKLKQQIRKPIHVEKIDPSELLSTGSTLLNLAFTGNPHGGLARGKYYLFVGDSSSGKTFLSLTCLAEAAINKKFDEYRFIYDNGEDGALMNFAKFFGVGVADRIESPSYGPDGEANYSDTIEEMYFHVDDAIEDGRPFIYIVDSMDVLTSTAEQSKFKERKKAKRANKKTAGIMSDGKAKINSSHLRALMPKLGKTDSILIILNQTRDNIGFGAMFEPKSRSGGKALKFYATVEMWSSVVKKIKKTIRGKPRQVGIKAGCQIKKNRFTGKERKVEVPIYHSHGIDDIQSCIDFLMDEDHWDIKGQTIHATDFEFEGTEKKLIDYIEENDLEFELREVVGGVWNEIEEAADSKRKPRYPQKNGKP